MIDDKQKLLCLMRLLQEETDPAHPMNAAQIYGSIVSPSMESLLCVGQGVYRIP